VLIKLHNHIVLFSEGLSTGAIVGIVLGAVALLLVIGGTAYLIVRCRKATQHETTLLKYL
jgi:mannose/fructose/N-acetylgalactosamine-specific phosphotransferase system component IIC